MVSYLLGLQGRNDFEDAEFTDAFKSGLMQVPLIFTCPGPQTGPASLRR